MSSRRGRKNAESSLDRIATAKPDIILMEIRLPDGNGAEMCRNFHLDKETTNIPIILMSANTDASVLAENRARDFIAKPFDVEELMAGIQEQVPS